MDIFDLVRLFLKFVWDYFNERKERNGAWQCALWRVVRLLYGGRHWHSTDRQTDRQTRTDLEGFFHVGEIGGLRPHFPNSYTHPPPHQCVYVCMCVCEKLFLFDIFCGSNLPSALLCLQLLVTSLSKAPLFDAAYYAWANDTSKLTETCVWMKETYRHCQRGHC